MAANVVVAQAPDSPGFYPHYASKTSFVLAGIQIAVGVFTSVLSIVHMAVFRGVEFMPSIVAYPVFGAFMIVAGILGIFAGKLKKTGPIVAFMVMSIIVGVFAVCAFISCFLFGLGFIVVIAHDTSGIVLTAMMFVFAVAYLVELIVSIWSVIISSRAVCCGRTQTSGAVLVYHQVKQTETND